MTKPPKEIFAGTESELISMTEDLDDLHHDVGAPAMRQGVAAMIENMQGAVRPTSRRTFLMGAGAAAVGGAAMMVIGGAPALAGASTRRLTAVRPEAVAFPPADLKGDLAVAAVAASLENLAVFAYTAALSAATAGKLGAVPPAVATFATTVKGQHQQHAGRLERRTQIQHQGRRHGDKPHLDPDGAVRLRQGDRHRRSGSTGHHPRDDRGADVSG